jgi:hypothetical protein
MLERRRSAEERRQNRRAAFVAAVRQCMGEETELALAQDLCETGIQLRRAGAACEPNTAVSLAFELPDGGDLLSVDGEVVFERAHGGYQATGVRFLTLSAESRARIARFLGGGAPRFSSPAPLL